MNASLWTAFLANFMFWTGTAAGGVAFAALLDLTGAQWAGPLRAAALRFHRFLPAAVVLYLVLLIGARAIYPWIAHPAGSSWLRFRPFALRDVAALIGIAVTASFCAQSSRAPSEPVQGETAPVAATIIFLVAYTIGFSVLAIDLVMSLDAPWGSALFPAYLFTANVYTAIAAAALAAPWKISAGDATLTDGRFADLGNLLLGFALVWMYLVWSQFLVIWYGNLPEETRYLVRLLYGRWRPLAWTIWTARFALPFIVLLSGAGKRRAPIFVIAATIAAGFWAECFLLVTPAASGIPSPWGAAAITAGFLALFAMVTRERKTPHVRS